jgi:hypothetical protein
MPKDTKDTKTKSSKDIKEVKEVAKEVKEVTKEVVKEPKEAKERSKHNAATDKAGLSFNVNTTKAWIKKQIEVSGHDQPKFHGAHIALTAVMESLLMSTLSLINSQLPKDKSSLYKITLPVLSYSLQTDDDFSRIFKAYLSSYDNDINYSEQFWMSRSDVNSFIESHFGDNIQLESRAYNMLAYCMLKYAGLLTRTSFHLMTYAGKKTLEPKAIRASVLIHTPETIANTIVMKLDDAVKNSSEDDDEGEGDSDEVKESKSSKKQVAKEVSDSESDKEDSDSDGEESEAESESEEKPVAKGKKASEKVVEKEEKKVKVKKSKD